MLIVANLGKTALANVTLDSDQTVLAPGVHALQTLVGVGSGAPLRVGSDGKIVGYVPVGTLGPMASYVFDLSMVTR